MDPIQPIGTQINAPNLSQSLAPLSALLGIQQQRQDLQTGAATLQQQQQTAQQRKAIAGIDWSKYDDGTGTISTDKMLGDPSLRASAGDQFLSVLQAGASARQTQLQNKQQLVNLRASSRAQFGSVVGRLAADPDVQKDTTEGRQKVADAISQFGDEGPDEANIARIYGGVVQHAPPGSLARGIKAIQLQAMDASGQIPVQTPQPTATTNPGGQVQFVNTNPNAGTVGTPLGQPVAQGMGPGVTYQQDASGRTFQVSNQNPGGARPVGGGGFTAPIAGQQEAMQDINSARGAATTLQIARNANAHLLSLSADTLTGPVSAWSGKAAAALGLPQGSGLQEIDAYLQRSALAQAQALPHTNAGLESAQKMMGTTSYTPQALQEKVKFADALNSGALAYTKGLNAAVGTGPNPDLSHYNAFRAAWAQNFDPDIYRAEDAIRRRDQAELTALKKRLGPSGMKDLATKSANLRQLEQGVIPGG